MLITRLTISRAARTLRRDGFTLVELLVVIGIIAILAGVALGPITNGIKKAKQSSGMQSAHAIGLAMYSYANDNSQCYPDTSGGATDASLVAQQLLGGGYVTDPAIFFISGGTATKYTGTIAAAPVSITKTNMSWDFATNGGAGIPSASYTYLPILWSSIQGGSEPSLKTGANTAITAIPTTANPFQQDGVAVFYISNASKFVNSSIVGAGKQVTIVSSSDNSGEASSSQANVAAGGG